MATRDEAVKKTAVLVSSFDKYCDCWDVLDYSIKKYWADCPFRIYMIVNSEEPSLDCITPLTVGSDQGWARNILDAMKMIPEPYILYLQEDYWLNGPVDTSAIIDYIALLQADAAYYIRLCACPPAKLQSEHDNRLGIIEEGEQYRTSLQASLWRKDVLDDLVHPSDSPWDFERHGSDRSNKYGDRFLAIKDPKDDVFQYVHRTAIVQGRWTTSAREYIKNEGLEVDLSTRQSENWWDDFKRQHPRLRRLLNVVRHPIRSFIKLLARVGESS